LTVLLSAWRSRLDEERVLQHALRRSGDGQSAVASLREPLARLLDSCRREARLTGMMQILLAGTFVRLAENALAVDRAHDAIPATGDEPIARPLFITGLPRSGTSFLQELLAYDAANRTPCTWETMCVVPHESTRRRLARAQLACGAANLLRPEIRRKHRLSARAPHECLTILAHRFMSLEFLCALRVPSYQTWLERQDFDPVYRHHRRFLQMLQRGAGVVPRWVLKAPAHLFALPSLFACYPDAHVVQLQRDPLMSVASMASLTRSFRRLFSRSTDAAEIGREQAELWARGLARATRFRAEHPALAGQFHDLSFSELAQDPMAAVERLYGALRWPLSAAVASGMRSFVVASQRPPVPRHSYTPEAFGLRRECERQRFRDYSERFGVAVEALGG
jgi:hypothetical protein